MRDIKYSYCLNENNELVHISSVSVENRHSHTYHCLECGQPLIAKIGKIKVPHFAHAAGTACDGESYLHKLAKRRIFDKFMSSDSFPITFVRDVPCQDSDHCLYCERDYCFERDVSIPSNLRTWKGNVVYDTCREEVSIGDFRPDLLLTCSTKPDREPAFIEVYKTHESTQEKRMSGYKMIETKKIEDEADIDAIIENGFVEGKNCQLFNFHPKLPDIKKKDMPIDRFILFRNGAAIIHRAVDYVVMCDKLNKRVDPNSVRELNMRGGIDIWGSLAANKQLDSYQTGLVYLLKKGLVIKNCILCKFYRFNDFHNSYICILYKSLGAQSPKPRQSMANTCPRYELNQELMNHPLSELEKEVSEVPV
ncbi:MAG: hypothetical protein IKT02_07715 [Bacteroidales bacterium]|nr:hypothetical protein [Bacteroidales bacterium]